MVGGEGVGTAMGMPILLLPLFSRLPLPPLLPLQERKIMKTAILGIPSKNIINSKPPDTIMMDVCVHMYTYAYIERNVLTVQYKF